MVAVRTHEPGDYESFSILMARFCESSGDERPDESSLRKLFRTALDPGSDFVFLVALEEGHAVGIMSLAFAESSYQTSRFAFGDDLFVDEPYRGCGVGKALIAAAAKCARDHGCSNILAGVGEQERGTLAFYARSGFRDLKCRLLSLPLAPGQAR